MLFRMAMFKKLVAIFIRKLYIKKEQKKIQYTKSLNLWKICYFRKQYVLK